MWLIDSVRSADRTLRIRFDVEPSLLAIPLGSFEHSYFAKPVVSFDEERRHEWVVLEASEHHNRARFGFLSGADRLRLRMEYWLPNGSDGATTETAATRRPIASVHGSRCSSRKQLTKRVPHAIDGFRAWSRTRSMNARNLAGTWRRPE